MPVIVWGIAAGRGATKDAAPGAFTWAQYDSREMLDKKDWQTILFYEKGE